MKRTVADIERMKTTIFEPFGTEYKYMVETLFDWYIAKLDGEERIRRFLADWDDEAKKYWLDVLEERIRLSEEDIYEN